jgi:hypothetical protein
LRSSTFIARQVFRIPALLQTNPLLLLTQLPFACPHSSLCLSELLPQASPSCALSKQRVLCVRCVDLFICV